MAGLTRDHSRRELDGDSERALPFALRHEGVSAEEAARRSQAAGLPPDRAWQSTEAELAQIARMTGPLDDGGISRTPGDGKSHYAATGQSVPTRAREPYVERWRTHPDPLVWLEALRVELVNLWDFGRTASGLRHHEWRARPGRVWTACHDAAYTLLPAGALPGTAGRAEDAFLIEWLSSTAGEREIVLLLQTFCHYRLRSAVLQNARFLSEALLAAAAADMFLLDLATQHRALTPHQAVWVRERILRLLPDATRDLAGRSGGKGPLGFPVDGLRGLARLAGRFPSEDATEAAVTAFEMEGRRGGPDEVALSVMAAAIVTPDHWARLTALRPYKGRWSKALIAAGAPDDAVRLRCQQAHARDQDLLGAMLEHPLWADPTIRAYFHEMQGGSSIRRVLEAEVAASNWPAASRLVTRFLTCAPVQALQWLERTTWSPDAQVVLEPGALLPLLTSAHLETRERAQHLIGTWHETPAGWMPQRGRPVRAGDAPALMRSGTRR